MVQNLLRNARLIPFRTPNYLRFHLLRLLYNAAPTSRRTRRWNGVGTKPCHLCGNHEDSTPHLYFLCPAVARAREQALAALKASDLPESFPDSLLLGKATKFSARFHLHFNFAVWVVRRWCSDAPPDPSASKTISEYTLASLTQHLSAEAERTHTGALREVLRQARKRSRAALTRLELSRLPPGAMVVFTDGSANPNPGPGGAGAVCLDPPSAWVTALGPSTNNSAELHAVGMAIAAYGCQLQGGQTLVIVLDSLITYRALTCAKKVRSNQSLVLAVRSLARSSPFRVEYLLVPSHAGIRGNEAADRVAALGARWSRKPRQQFPELIDFGTHARRLNPPDWDWWTALPPE